MMFIRRLSTPKYLKFSPLKPKFRRMASFYNVDIAGLTDEQAEVR